MARFRYDASYEPPAPVVPCRIWSRAAPDEVRVVALLVDTGADCTCIPEVVARSLALPIVEHARVAGVGEGTRRVTIHEAIIEIAGCACVAPLVALDQETILGRDLLARFVTTLDGSRRRLTIAVRSSRASLRRRS